MSFFGLNASGPVKTLNATPSPAAINSAGASLKNAVRSAKSVANALNVVSQQLANASANLRKNAPAIANTTATLAKNVSGAPVVASMVGGYNAAMINAVPKSMIANGAKNAVVEAANQLKNLSGAAKNASKAVTSAIKTVGGGANYVAKNVDKVTPASINNALQNANKVLNAGVTSLNGAAQASVAPNVRVAPNVTRSHLNAVKNVAKTVNAAAKGGRKITKRNKH
jgi:hypothetical protein